VDKAIELLKKYMELNPGASEDTQAAVWWLSGKGYQKLNDRDEAIECYKRSLEIKPDFSRALESINQITGE
jgi:tetratricopeptide (TPR) repeat protein